MVYFNRTFLTMPVSEAHPNRYTYTYIIHRSLKDNYFFPSKHLTDRWIHTRQECVAVQVAGYVQLPGKHLTDR